MNNGIHRFDSGIVIRYSHECELPDPSINDIIAGDRYHCDCGKKYRFFPADKALISGADLPARWVEVL